jgi:hypothetical protein
MLATDAYAFLDVDNPLCAWATYRGALVCAPGNPGFISVWTAGLIRASDPGRMSFESAVEAVRVAQFSHRISRLRGMFCLLDAESAKRACSWDQEHRTHFQPEYLAELSLTEAGTRRDHLDANWITNAPIDTAGHLTDGSWIRYYWAGDPYPNNEPIWETLVDGRLIVLGTDIRQRAYLAVKSEFPDSLMFLEIARQAAWVGSDLGTISAFCRIEENEIVLDYVMNMMDAENSEVLGRLAALRASGHAINWADMKPHIDQDSFGRVPDFRPYGFRRPVHQMRQES